MPNFGTWEILTIVFIVITGGWVPFILCTKAAPLIVREIRRIWHNSDPGDNHKSL